ncbi:lycopene cyclase domain-containing protein [Parafrigoribacterium soli]|uniref:lycopene cyclase domain-containing protein n=1 Tax=Parafrigoribacterium soli TaxID=3144663 RepID=UPI0032F063F6
MNYAVLSIIFLAGAAVVLVLALALQPHRRALLRRWWLPVAVSGVVVLVLTAVFDNVMISAGLVAYDPRVNSGLAIGSAPLEDFTYPLAGLMLLPALWLLLRKQDADARP